MLRIFISFNCNFPDQEKKHATNGKTYAPSFPPYMYPFSFHTFQSNVPAFNLFNTIIFRTQVTKMRLIYITKPQQPDSATTMNSVDTTLSLFTSLNPSR